MTHKNGTLIVLNGASSSGKSSIARELVALLGTQGMHTGSLTTEHP